MSKTQQAADLIDRFLDETAAVEEVEGAAITGPDFSSAMAEWCAEVGVDMPTPQALGRALGALGYPREKVGREYCRIGLCLSPLPGGAGELEDFEIDVHSPAPPEHLSDRASAFFEWVVGRSLGLTMPQIALLISCLEHWDLCQSFRRRLADCLERKPDATRDQKLLHQMMVTHGRDFTSTLAALGLDGYAP